MVPYIRRDMLIIENQLPLLLLEKLVAVERSNDAESQQLTGVEPQTVIPARLITRQVPSSVLPTEPSADAACLAAVADINHSDQHAATSPLLDATTSATQEPADSGSKQTRWSIGEAASLQACRTPRSTSMAAAPNALPHGPSATSPVPTAVRPAASSTRSRAPCMAAPNAVAIVVVRMAAGWLDPPTLRQGRTESEGSAAG
ncbi:hypothetical protein ABZP36_034052 [Zizania latifolia]